MKKILILIVMLSGCASVESLDYDIIDCVIYRVHAHEQTCAFAELKN